MYAGVITFRYTLWKTQRCVRQILNIRSYNYKLVYLQHPPAIVNIFGKVPICVKLKYSETAVQIFLHKSR